MYLDILDRSQCYGIVIVSEDEGLTAHTRMIFLTSWPKTSFEQDGNGQWPSVYVCEKFWLRNRGEISWLNNKLVRNSTRCPIESITTRGHFSSFSATDQ